jgi:hypothetical protein
MTEYGSVLGGMLVLVEEPAGVPDEVLDGVVVGHAVRAVLIPTQ